MPLIKFTVLPTWPFADPENQGKKGGGNINFVTRWERDWSKKVFPSLENTTKSSALDLLFIGIVGIEGDGGHFFVPFF